jgi:hypothetical protein
VLSGIDLVVHREILKPHFCQLCSGSYKFILFPNSVFYRFHRTCSSSPCSDSRLVIVVHCGICICYMQVSIVYSRVTTVLSDNKMDLSHLASAALCRIFGTVRTLPSSIIPHSVSTWRLMEKDHWSSGSELMQNPANTG